MSFDKLKIKIEEEIKKNEASGNVRSVLCRNAMEGLLQEVGEVETASSREKYTLVFIGEVGSGKTTAIMHLLNLVFEENKELLVTGSGGSTVCEVRIKLTDKSNSYIEAEFLDKAELLKLADHFADSIMAKNGNSELLGNALPQEITRALRNILNLRFSRDSNKKRYDEAVNELKEVGEEKFRKLIKDKIEELYSKELCSTIKSTSAERTNQIEFIKKKFEELNSAKGDNNYSIARQITIFLNKELFGTSSLWEKYDCVIDTKGLDRPTGRADIDKLVKKKDHILVFTSAFANAPQPNCLAQLKRYADTFLGDSANYWEQRSHLMILPRMNEPENVVDAEGVYEEGLYLKGEAVKERLQELDLKSINLEDFVLFYNAKQKRQTELKDILNALKDITDNVVKNSPVRNNLLTKYEEIKEASIDDSVVEKIKAEAVSVFYKEIDWHYLFNEDFSVLFEMDAPHWNTKNAINRNKGKFWNHDIYFLARSVIEKNVSNDFYTEVVKVEESIKEVIPIESIKRTLFIKIKDSKKRFIEKINTDVKTKLQEEVFSDSSKFWEEVAHQKLRGNGYNERVLDCYRNALEYMNFALREIIVKHWKELMKEYAQLLGVEDIKLLESYTSYQLTGFTIKKYSNIKNTEVIDIPKDKRKCIIFTGENGYGKTSILKAILAGLIGVEDEGKSLISLGDDIEVYYTNEEKIYKNHLRYEAKHTPTQESHIADEPVENFQLLRKVAAYGAHRIGLSAEPVSKSEHLFDHKKSYAPPFVDIENLMVTWEGNTKQVKYYNAIKEVFLDFMEDYIDDLKVVRDGAQAHVQYKQRGREEYTVYAQLASGFKAVIGLIGDICYRLSVEQPELLSDLTGIVIIDEFDMHLHPIWQREILIRLTKYFPRVQFIISTHSPIPFLGAPPETTIIKVDRNEGSINATKLDVDFTELLPNAILTSPIFNLDKIIPYSHNSNNQPVTDVLYSEHKEREEALSENANKNKENIEAIEKLLNGNA